MRAGLANMNVARIDHGIDRGIEHGIENVIIVAPVRW